MERTESIIGAATASAPTQSEASVPKKELGGKKHKGKGAKERAATNFRTRKNEETYNNRMAANREFRDSFCPNVDGLDQLLASLSSHTTPSHPPREVTLGSRAHRRATACQCNHRFLC